MSNAGELINDCKKADTIILLDEDILDDISVEDKVFKWIFSIKEVHMCIVVQQTSLDILRIKSELIRGNCSGPTLSIINNDNLTNIFLPAVFLVENYKDNSEKTFIIRGNRNLNIHEIGTAKQYDFIDLQKEGECMTPAPFTGFDGLEGCQRMYGPLFVEPMTSSIPLPLLKEKIEYEGCLQIQNTSLSSVKFLEAFSSFKKMQGCQQYIQANKALCMENIDYITRVFADINIQNNRESCDYCLGGLVTEEYLMQNAGCRYVYGDLKIIGWKEKPAHVDALTHIRSITGRLIITNNSDLYNFTYFSNLEEVGKLEGGNVVVIVSDNSDLLELQLPLVDKSGNKSRMMFVNNPKLTTLAPPRITTPEEKIETITRTQKPEEYASTLHRSNIRTLDHGSNAIEQYKFYALGGAAILCTLILLSAVVMQLRRKKKSIHSPFPSQLTRRSRKVLLSLCKEVLSKNPMVWFSEDQNLLWHCANGKQDDEELVVRIEKLKSLMLPLSQNAALPFVREVDLDKLLQLRAQSFMGHDYVVVIGESSDIKKIVPHLPVHIGGSALFFDSPANISLQFKCVDVQEITKNITQFTYEAGDVRQKVKILNVLFYKWEQKRLPTEYDELLRLLWLCCHENACCVSNRRKEVFSMLHLLFMVVLKLKEGHLTEAFQCHLHNCNGTPLDRNEMLLVMRILLEWAKRTSAIPAEIENACTLWCEMYEKMSTFASDHLNVMHIRPQHTEGGIGQLKKEKDDTCLNAGRLLSERPFSPMRDVFRRRKNEQPNLKGKSIRRKVVKGIDVSSTVGTGCTSTSATSSTNVTTASSSKVSTYSGTTSSVSSAARQDKDRSNTSTIMAIRSFKHK